MLNLWMPWTYTVLCKRNARELFPEVSEITLILAIKLRTFGASIVLMPAKFRKQGDESTEMKFRGMRRNCINVLKDKSSLPRKYIQCISLLLTIVLLLPVAQRSRPYATCISPTMHLICAPPPPLAHDHWRLLFISPGYYSRPKRNWKQFLCKILGDK